MKYFELNKEEEKISADFDKGRLVSAGTKLEKKRYQTYAKATLQKTKNINIRLPEKDIHKLKAKAAQKGMPYQTLLSSIIHQYTNGEKVRL